MVYLKLHCIITTNPLEITKMKTSDDIEYWEGCGETRTLIYLLIGMDTFLGNSSAESTKS